MKYADENKFTFDKIFQERVSGNIKAENREEYKKLKYMLRKDDILIVTDLDRLGRNADDVIYCAQIEKLNFFIIKNNGSEAASEIALDSGNSENIG